jgi:hypothetical protein
LQTGGFVQEEVAFEIIGQQAAYAGAIERTTQLPVLEKWLYLPVVGGIRI